MRAFLFPGQGTQRLGMGGHLHDGYESARAVYRWAADVLGFDVAGLCRTGPAEQLQRTRYAQPAVFVSSLAALAVVEEAGIGADAAAGHSVGELAALVAAGALDRESGLRLVDARARLMDAVETPGSMCSVLGLDEATVRAVCTGVTNGVVVPALVNGPEHVVISGNTAAVDEAAQRLRDAGAIRITALVVSHAFHSPLFAPVAGLWAEAVGQAPIRTPMMPVALNTLGRLSTDPVEIRRALVDQLTGRVDWMACVRAIVATGVLTAVEVGSSRVLQGLARAIDSRLDVASMVDGRSVARLLAEARATSAVGESR